MADPIPRTRWSNTFTFCIRQGYVEVAEILLTAKANPEARDEKENILHSAVLSGVAEAVIKY